ncbi:M50 family metallopeptidase [Jatrophihabitans sp. YIM 134969]
MWLYALGVLIFVVGLLASIALHELGHLSFAKLFGVKVTQYMVGFGPTAWSRKRGETEYGIKWIPLGGYIRMIGMIPPRADGKRSRWPRRLALAVEDFRATSRSEVLAPEDEPRQFYRLTPGKKMLIMLGGPIMNFVIFLVLASVLLLTIGTQTQGAPTTTVALVSDCVVPAGVTATEDDPCPAGSFPAPAKGKLQNGDVITAVNGTPVTSWDQESQLIRSNPGTPITISVKRGDGTAELTVTPRAVQVTEDGRTTTVGQVGFYPYAPVSFVKSSPSEVPGQIGSQIAQGVTALGALPSKISSLFGTVFEGKQRDPEGAVGVVGLARIGGEVSSSNAFDLEQKTAILISLLAGLNLLLFFFNLLPLLPLDGGHVAGALLEAAKRGWGRLRKRPWAGHVDTAQMLPVMYGVAGVLLVFTLLVVYADIVKPITISS